MAMIAQLIGILLNIKKNFRVAGPQDERHVAVLEQALNVQLPPSYRSFILEFGGIDYHEACISGIWGDPLRNRLGSAYGDTTRFREEHDLPQQFVIIQPDEEAPFCLDTGSKRPDGECPVVCFELLDKYPNRLAPSFEDFLVEWLELRIR